MEIELIKLEGHEQGVNCSHLPRLPEIPQYGNLSMKEIRLVQRLLRVNELIQSYANVWEYFLMPTQNPIICWDQSEKHKKQFLIQEEIIYHLKLACDSVLAICGLVALYLEKNETPDKLKIEGISDYTQHKQSGFHDFDEHLDFLEELNELANSCKHSFTDDYTMLIGQHEPSFYSFHTKRGKVDETTLRGVSVTELIKGFNEFYKTYLLISSVYAERLRTE